MEFVKAIVWEKSMRLAEHVLLVCRSMPRHQRLGLRDQMTRAATSIPSNIAEGWVRESFKEKVHFLSIAHGSPAELHTQLLLCRRAGVLTRQDVEPAPGLADEIGRMLTALKQRWRHARKPETAPKAAG
jgi:four helix bundle protein